MPKYYEIDEVAARRAKEANSFYSYVGGGPRRLRIAGRLTGRRRLPNGRNPVYPLNTMTVLMGCWMPTLAALPQTITTVTALTRGCRL